MSVIIAISKVLDIKAVQWALLCLTTILLIASGVQSFRLWVSQKEARFYKAKSAESEAFLQAQNAQVLEMKKQGDAAKLRAVAAVEESRKIAGEYEKKILALKNRPIREDCCGAIEDAKNIVLGVLP